MPDTHDEQPENHDEDGDGRDGLTVLGRGPMVPQHRIECFPVAAEVVRIELSTDELICRCPVTGQTDLYRASIVYRPAGRAIETKSLKLYLATFQGHAGMFAEHLTDRIAGDVIEASGAEAVEVTLVQHVRGGIATTVTAVRGQPLSR